MSCVSFPDGSGLPVLGRSRYPAQRTWWKLTQTKVKPISSAGVAEMKRSGDHIQWKSEVSEKFSSNLAPSTIRTTHSYIIRLALVVSFPASFALALLLTIQHESSICLDECNKNGCPHPPY